MNILKTVGEKVKVIRKAQGISQEKLGELTGLSTNYVGQIERGQRQVALDTLEKITVALGTDLGTIFEDFRATGKKSPTETEISAMNESARSLGIEDIKALRLMADRLAKRGS